MEPSGPSEKSPGNEGSHQHGRSRNESYAGPHAQIRLFGAQLAERASDPELAGAALAALLIAAGHDGAWHRDWTDPRTAPKARRTTDQLASIFYRDQHRHDQELPPEP